jgi:uncharacterized protein YcfJ
MKTTICLLALVTAATSAQAQLFTPSTVQGAALGAIAGGVIGNNTGSHNGTQGAVIGALAGGLLGSAQARSQRESSGYYYNSTPSYYYTTGDSFGPPVYRPTPVYSRPSRTATTTLLGGVAGAIIGHNNGRRAWQGAAIGAGAGYVLGRISEPTPVRRPVALYSPYAYYPRSPVVTAQSAAQPQQITIINNYYGTTPTAMSSANTLFGR